jgi:hypothetical protein
MMEQPGLNFVARSADQAEKLSSWFYAILERGAWVKGRDICALMATNERVLRQIADRSQGRVISGQHGYKLTKFATTEEIDHAERWLLSQGHKMIDRAREIRIARNRSGAAA